MKINRTDIATFIAILFHVCGWIGISFTGYRDWFIANTPLNLCLMAILLIWVQQPKNFSFFILMLVCIVVGIAVEMIGVNTSKLFGHYQYGEVLGKKINGVPWLIGINWFVIIFSSGSCMLQFHDWFTKKTSGAGMEMSATLTSVSLVVDSAILATLFDWVMEPAAVKLGFWSWNNGTVPLYNYGCWFVISILLLLLFKKLSLKPVNHFAVHLFIIQVLFFLAIRTFPL